jgi:glutathione S-transferase
MSPRAADATDRRYRLFSWEHSYFSGKVRAYLRYKQRMGGLGPGFEDVLATPDLLQGLLAKRSGSSAVPQLEAPDGTWVQDSSEIIDFCEAAHPAPAVRPDPQARPRQALISYLIALLADEWLVVPAFWERWYFSEDGRTPSHRRFNEQQWGAMLAPGAPGDVRRAVGAGLFEQGFGISHSRRTPKGVYAGLVHLGVTEATEAAWQASQHRVLGMLEAHFARHDYVLGGRPSLADFALMGPLYAHLYRDAVSGFALRSWFPLVCEWVERTNGEGALNARAYDQKLYSLGPDGELVARAASSDAGEWLPDADVPETLLPLLQVFFEEMWPVLTSSMARLAAFIASDDHKAGGELPGKTFLATPGFEQHQTGTGALTHAYTLGGVAGRRMVVPIQIWMLGRMQQVLEAATANGPGRAAVEALLRRIAGADALFELDERLAGCRVRKQGARLYSLA